MAELHDAAIAAATQALARYEADAYFDAVPAAHATVAAFANDPNVRDGIAAVLGAHQEERMMATPTYAVRCICGWRSEAESFPQRRQDFRQHVADAILRKLGGGDE